MKNKSLKILVAEDDHDLAWMLYSMLTSKGFEITIVYNSAAAASLLQEGSYDLLLMDMLLQGANGAELCKSLKKDPLIGNMPVIMMSAHPDGERVCMEAGAERFIFKPFELSRLLSLIHELVDKQFAMGVH